MNISSPPLFGVVCTLLTSMTLMAIEEAPYTVVQKDGRYEIREYAPHILAETRVEASFEDAGNRAFRTLFRFISGENRTQESIAMTTPVGQEPTGEKIPMTAPVGQEPVSEKIPMTTPVGQEQSGDDVWIVTFMMPSSYTLETVPLPNDPAVTIRAVPARRMAAIRYSGFWSERRYQRYKDLLMAWIDEQGLTITGPPIWARYNAPFTPWFLRRNEILVPVANDTETP